LSCRSTIPATRTKPEDAEAHSSAQTATTRFSCNAWGRSKGEKTAFLQLQKGRNEADSDTGLLITFRSIALPMQHKSGKPFDTLVIESVRQAPKPKAKPREDKPAADAVVRPTAEAPAPTIAPKHAALLEVMRSDPNGSLAAWGATLGVSSRGGLSELLGTMAKRGLVKKVDDGVNGRWAVA
jgi:hypothetical protein